MVLKEENFNEENGTAVMGKAMWIREMLKEQDEELDSDNDPEWANGQVGLFSAPLNSASSTANWTLF